MEDLYCHICKDYKPHKDKKCTSCGEEYDENRKRYIICGSSDHPDVIESTKKLLEKNPDAIIIDEDIALSHKLGTLPSRTNYLQSKDLYMYDMEDLYNDVPKKLRGKKTESVRNSKEDPKIGRNASCPCGSGKKYKKCCLNKNK